MKLSTDLVVAISRAYALTEIIPLRHQTVRDALRAVGELLHEARPVEVSITESGLALGGTPIEDGQGMAREFARDLRAVGAERLEVTDGARGADVEGFIVALRNTISGEQVDIREGLGRPSEGGLCLHFKDGQEARFVSEAVAGGGGGIGEQESEGLARSINRLFEGDGSARSPEPERAEPSEEPDEADRADAEVVAEVAPEPVVGEDPERSADLETFEVGALAEAARAFLESGPGEQEGLAEDLERQAEASGAEGELDPVVNAVFVLARGAADRSPGGEDALEMARRLATPAVARRFTLRLAWVWDEVERSRLLEGVRMLADQMAEPVSEALSEARDRRARRVYLDALLAMGHKSLEAVEKMLDDSRWFVVRNAVALLGDLGGEKAVEQLTSPLAHEDARVRRETVRALAKLGGEDAGDLALGMLEDPDPDVRSAANRAVGILKVEKAVRPLLERLEEEADDGVVEEILKSLGQIGDPGAVPAIEKRAAPGLFSRQSRAVRIAGYQALASIGTPHARKLLEEAVADRDAEVRAAVETLLDDR